VTPCREYPVRYPNGYGKRYIRGSKPYRSVLVHRWIWEQAHGPIPEGVQVMHLCDNKACYRLDHLQLGTQAENMADMHAKGRGRKNYSRKAECNNGHPHDEKNTYVDSEGWQHCRACDAARHREARARRRVTA
jgi:hypothetical protein